MSYVLPIVRYGARYIPKIALTFDDGPNAHTTPRVLKILQHHHVRATFFLIGKYAKQYPQIARDIISEGHSVGGHTFRHNLADEQTDNSIFDFKRGNDAIEEVLSKRISFIRVPGFEYRNKTANDRFRIDELLNGEVNRRICAKELVVVDRDVETADWNGTPAHGIVRRAAAKTVNGSIILLHDGSHKPNFAPSSFEPMLIALPIIIDTFSRRGYSFETIDNLTLHYQHIHLL